MRSPLLSRTAPAFAAILLLAALPACNTKPTDITSPDTDDQKAALAHAKPVELPPSILASKSYRCKDNSTVFIDWMSDQKTAILRAKKDGDPTTVKSADPGGEMTADGGASVKGSADAGTIDAALPGKPSQSCKS